MKSSGIKNPLFIFLFSLAVIIGSSYSMYLHFDFSHSSDTKSYLKMAKGDFHVNPTHRYRWIIPMAAATITWPINQIYRTLWPQRAENEWGLRLAFFIVNSLLVAFTGMLIFYTCLAYGSSFISSLIGLIAVLTSRWIVYIAGLPLIDSLYLLVIALFFYGIRKKSKTALLITILIGPFAKESFIFIAPLILLYGRNILGLKSQIPLFLLSGILVFGVRQFIDHKIGAEAAQSMTNAMDHFDNIQKTILRICSLRGIGEIFTVLGIFTFIIMAGFAGGRGGRIWMKSIGSLGILFFVAVLIHVLLSSDVARMLFIGAPLYAVMIALILDQHPYFRFYRTWKDGQPVIK